MKMNNANAQKILIALNNQLKMHLFLRDKTFRNGFVKEIKADFFMFEDDVNGLEPIFYMDLLNVESFREDGR